MDQTDARAIMLARTLKPSPAIAPASAMHCAPVCTLTRPRVDHRHLARLALGDPGGEQRLSAAARLAGARIRASPRGP